MSHHELFLIDFTTTGSLEIQGDVTRDIVLGLRESTAPVRIEPGTKNLTLTRKLDKEGVEGPSTVTFTILCDKRHHTEPVSWSRIS